MAEAVRITTGQTKSSPLSALGGKSFDDLVETVLPIVVAALTVLTFALTIQQVSTLVNWSGDFDGAGTFVVGGGCEEAAGLGADQWLCNGTLSADDAAEELPSTLVTSSGAFVSDRPYVGEKFNVFFKPENVGQVYADSDRLNEMTRIYLALLPRALIFVGSIIWLVGWYATRNLNAADFLARDNIRLPQRFLWRSRGATWIILGVVLGAVNYFLATRIIGSLGSV